ncbi:MAG TPA: hypothetical protein PKV44_07485 [Bacillota bacterium]|nr:hypothetical protein [Bacillota bacterium]
MTIHELQRILADFARESTGSICLIGPGYRLHLDSSCHGEISDIVEITEFTEPDTHEFNTATEKKL